LRENQFHLGVDNALALPVFYMGEDSGLALHAASPALHAEGIDGSPPPRS
jgi:hypothetical protein